VHSLFATDLILDQITGRSGMLLRLADNSPPCTKGGAIPNRFGISYRSNGLPVWYLCLVPRVSDRISRLCLVSHVWYRRSDFGKKFPRSLRSLGIPPLFSPGSQKRLSPAGKPAVLAAQRKKLSLAIGFAVKVDFWESSVRVF